MTIPRHPSDELLLARAAGALDPATSLIVDTHVALCPDCRAEADLMDAVGAELMEALPPLAMSDGALERLFAVLDAGPADATPAHPVEPDLPAPVRDLAVEALRLGRWRRLAPGVEALDLPVDPRAPAGSVQLLRLQPGRGVPRHSHSGQELTLVLDGAFRDERGRFGIGDLVLCDDRDTHRPVAEPGRVCLALAVTEAPLRLSGALGLIQKAFARAR